MTVIDSDNGSNSTHSGTSFESPDVTPRTLTQNAATTFRIEDCTYRNEYERERWKRIHRLQHNRQKRQPGIHIWADADIGYNRDMVLNLSSQLDLTKRQRDKAIAQHMSINHKKMGIRCELIAFAVCMHVINRDERCKRAYHPSRAEDNNSTVFMDMAEYLKNRYKFRNRDIISIYNKIENHLK